MSAQISIKARLLLVSGAWGPPAACALALAALRPADAAWELAAVLTALAAALLQLARMGRFPAQWLLALSASGLILWPEMALRLGGFRFELAGNIFSGVDPIGTIEARHDPDLFWTLPPEHPAVNSRGFLGPEFEIPKPPGVYRILFFGDSCTQQGFPSLVERELNSTASPGLRFEAVNLGIAGYSSWQGRAVAERWGEVLGGDAAFVYFGWNDHWLASGMTDAERARWSQRLRTRLLLSSRTFQASVRFAGPKRPRLLSVPRVDLESYASNLEAIGELAGRGGARIVLITAPSAYQSRGVPDFMVEQGFAASKRDLLIAHHRYNERVRDVARRRGWALLDLEREMEQLEAADELFMADGIHFTQQGLRWIAERIARELRALRS